MPRSFLRGISYFIRFIFYIRLQCKKATGCQKRYPAEATILSMALKRAMRFD